jgi:hypothetical protein
MARITNLVEFLLLFVVLKLSDGLQYQLSGMEKEECLSFKREVLVSQCNLIGRQYTIGINITIQWELFLYCVCVVTEIQLYTVKFYVSGCYVVHVPSLPHGYM